MPTEEKAKLIEKLFAGMDPELDITVAEFEDESFSIDFPREDEQIVLSFEDLMNYRSFENLSITRIRVSSNFITQFPIMGHSFALEYLTEKHRFEYENEGVKIKVINNPLLLGIGAVSLGEYSKYCPPCTPYTALHIEYATEAQKLSESEEYKLAKSFMFEYSHLAGLAFTFSEIRDVYWDGYDENEDVVLNVVKVNSLKSYSDGMDLFKRAMDANDQEISFLFYYKLIEFYAPVAAKRSAFDHLTQRLDSLRIKGATNSDIDAILQISANYRSSQSDKDLAQALLKDTIDIIEFFPKLPEEIRKKISKAANFNPTQLTYDTNQEIINKIFNLLGSILYSTRNSIVHAKSNYTPDQNECRPEDLEQLNLFLRQISYVIINWYDRLPNHIKYNN